MLKLLQVKIWIGTSENKEMQINLLDNRINSNSINNMIRTHRKLNMQHNQFIPNFKNINNRNSFRSTHNGQVSLCLDQLMMMRRAQK